MRLSEHFGDSEFACHCGCGFGAHPGDVNPLLVAGLEELRAKLGGLPIRIRSGCRCASYNASKRVGGAPLSLHVKGDAADIRVKGMHASDLYVAATGIVAFGGLGLSDLAVGGFVHVDVRPRLPSGEFARWKYLEGRESVWKQA